jgi:hypothetical protein
MAAKTTTELYKGRFETALYVQDALKLAQAKRVLEHNPRTNFAEILTDVLEDWAKVQLSTPSRC